MKKRRKTFEPERKNSFKNRKGKESSSHHNKPLKSKAQTESQIIVGVVRKKTTGFFLLPANKRDRNQYEITDSLVSDGEIVKAELLPEYRRYRGRIKIAAGKLAKVTEIIGKESDPNCFSVISIHTHNLPHEFSKEAIREASGNNIPDLAGRTDLREIPLVTIDGEDARDFDDAVYAEPDNDIKNKGGFKLVIAIADVSYYVKTDSNLDREALQRGNSVYFPNMVLPMLPENLSNNLCSLRPNEDRGCVAVEIWINSEGKKIRHNFLRGLMRSHARITYNQLHQTIESRGKQGITELYNPVIINLYSAYKALLKDRKKRNTLELDIPEYKIFFNEDGSVKEVKERERFESHKIIEEMMIATNIAAAESLSQAGIPAIYRVHEKPDPMKIIDLQDFLSEIGINVGRGQLTHGGDFNRLLKQSIDRPDAKLINSQVLRAQMQAYYTTDNHGHFGLGLNDYCHFTSPIRRYSDLVVHRALIALVEGKKSLQKELELISEHISETERKAMQAERETVSRYIAAYMQDMVGKDFSGVISGIGNSGIFVTITDTGTEGMLPYSLLGDDYFHYNEIRTCVIGRRSKAIYNLGDKIEVRIKESNPISGMIVLEKTRSFDKKNKPKPAKKIKKRKS